MIEPSERLEQWRRIWRGVGPARVAEDLASPAMSTIVDEIGSVDLSDKKRAAAKNWLDQHHTKIDGDRRWTNLRSWIALGVSVAAVAISLVYR